MVVLRHFVLNLVNMRSEFQRRVRSQRSFHSRTMKLMRIVIVIQTLNCKSNDLIVVWMRYSKLLPRSVNGLLEENDRLLFDCSCHRTFHMNKYFESNIFSNQSFKVDQTTNLIFNVSFQAKPIQSYIESCGIKCLTFLQSLKGVDRKMRVDLPKYR